MKTFLYLKPYNLPSTKEVDPKFSYADEKFEKLQEYYSYMNGRMKEPHNPLHERADEGASQPGQYLSSSALGHAKYYSYMNGRMKEPHNPKPYNLPSTKEVDPKFSYADEKFEKLQEYYSYMNGRMKEPHNPVSTFHHQHHNPLHERADEGASQPGQYPSSSALGHAKYYSYMNGRMKEPHNPDLKRLLFATDQALMSMVLLKLNKKMDTSEAKIKNTQAKIPFGLYVSPEFKCLDTSYYVASAHNQEDAQMILSSERKPHCYTFRDTSYYVASAHNQEDAQMILSSERKPHCYTFRGTYIYLDTEFKCTHVVLRRVSAQPGGRTDDPLQREEAALLHTQSSSAHTSYYVASAHNQEDAQMILSSERKPHCYTFRDTSYYVASAHNQEDAQMILSSERKPHCYTFRAHRHSETQYVGPHAEQFQAKDPSQGLYCHSDDNWSDAQTPALGDAVGPHAEQFQAKDPSQGLYCHSDDNWSDAQCIYKTPALGDAVGPHAEQFQAKDPSQGLYCHSDDNWSDAQCIYNTPALGDAVGPHAEQFQAKDPSQGLYCHSDDNWSDAQCIYKRYTAKTLMFSPATFTSTPSACLDISSIIGMSWWITLRWTITASPRYAIPSWVFSSFLYVM
ncbi:Molybdopterin oxidoreductase Fe4S4 domain protein [Operophtera brumata]|uniref:Molybdopterin oxidoreductase Fe4S4 domain protein n=1 Tax=Operophtera brumata TaxID=104452 RepID=A0A0L7L895_OPEBR|nr:Molybdopterin oxidoreductase Fe4S4 domain protein [Operophtera brumata]